MVSYTAYRAPTNLLIRSRWLRVLCVILGALLLVDALTLMAHGMFNVGVIVPAAIGSGLLCVVAFQRQLSHVLARRGGLRRLWRLGWCLFAMWLASLLVFWALIALHMRTDEVVQPAQAIIVLGSATRDGQPSEALAKRLDVAAQLASAQPDAWIVTSGGVDFGQTESEGRIMARYLHDRHGIASTRLIAEEASTSTALNLSLSSALLAQHNMQPDAPIAVVTSDFHTLRARWIAKKVGLRNVYAVGAPTPLPIRFNAWLREYFAVASSWLLREF